MKYGIIAIMLAGVVACADDDDGITGVDERAAASALEVDCEADNGGITLPPGFCASVVADLTMDGEAARARHLVVTTAGVVLVAINAPRNQQPSFGIVALRDADQDGDADEQAQFSPGLGGSGLFWRSNRLYFGANDRVVRFNLPPGRLTPLDAGETVVSGLIATGDHISKTVVLGNDGMMFVNIGSESNSCQEDNREVGSPGVFPCPEMPIRAGVWRFDANGTNQTLADGVRWGTGLRNMVALAVNPSNGQLYGVQHGRDQLFEHWASRGYTQADDAVLPAEEFVRITQGSDNGWPYCYFDAVEQNRKVLAPEYGGDGVMVSGGPHNINCAAMNQPLATFGAHWAPNGMHFYTGRQFPARYRGGAFVAFHGGFDRAPLPNEGYNIMFVPFGANGTPSGAPELFADGFAGHPGPLPANAVHRPVGVTEGPDGSLYVSDDRGGRIWRIVFRGQ
jgi:glucose/arabinose dehydrogenase